MKGVRVGRVRMEARSVILNAGRRVHGRKIEGRAKVFEGLARASIWDLFCLTINFIVFVATDNFVLYATLF